MEFVAFPSTRAVIERVYRECEEAGYAVRREVRGVVEHFFVNGHLVAEIDPEEANITFDVTRQDNG